MAYDPGQLVQGICVHSIGRQQAGPPFGLPESAGRVVSDRILAWGKLEFYNLGPFAIFHPIRGTSGSYPYTGTMEDGRPSLYGIHDTAYVACFCSHGHKTNYSVFPKAVPGLCPAATILYFSGDYVKYARLYAVSLAAGLLFMTDIPIRIYARFKYSMITAAALLGIFWLCVYCMRMGMDDPFLYFRF